MVKWKLRITYKFPSLSQPTHHIHMIDHLHDIDSVMKAGPSQDHLIKITITKQGA
jgi:hypothetical protein